MTEKRYLLVKCIQNQWGIVDKTLDGVDQLILIHYSKLTLNEIVNKLNEKEQLKEENKVLKNELLKVVKQLYSSQSNLIYEYSSNISEDTKELKETLEKKYGKYGLKL